MKKFSAFLKQIATPLTTAVFVVVAITGVMLFFHVGHSVKRMHEWIGMIFVVAGLLHVFRNFAPFKSVLRRKTFWISAVLVVILSFALFGREDHHRERNRQGEHLGETTQEVVEAEI